MVSDEAAHNRGPKTYCAKPEPMKVYSTLLAAAGEPSDGSFAMGLLFPFSSSWSCSSDLAFR